MIDFFQAYKPSITEEFFELHSANNKVVRCYSQRSLNREAKSLTQKLLAAAHDKKKLIWVAPFHTTLLKFVNPEYLKFLIWISPAEFSDPLMHIINSEEKWNYFLRDISMKDSFSIEIHHSLKSPEVNQFIREHLEQSAIRIKTIEHFEKPWEYNFYRNKKTWLNTPDITTMSANEQSNKPDLFVLGGSSVNNSFSEISKHKHIWCADTAFSPLVQNNIIPEVVFSLDAGMGSLEHFLPAKFTPHLKKVSLVIDPLSFPPVYSLPFQNIYTYAGSHPLIQKARHKHTYLENMTGDVSGLMDALFLWMYKEPIPEVVGKDGTHISYVTHVRGSGYYYRQYGKMNKLFTPETYFLALSRRYS